MPNREFIREDIEREFKKFQLPGLIVFIRNGAADSDVLFHGAYGLHEVQTAVPLEEDCLFPIASQTKTFTAVAMLQLAEQLAEQGLLSLDDKLIKHLPELSHPALADVTLKDVMRHYTPIVWKKGISDGWDEGEVPFPSADELRRIGLMNLLDRDELQKWKKNTFNYSNLAVTLLGMVIEKISGLPYSTYITKNILESHNLTDMYVGLSAEDVARRTNIPTGYYIDKNDGLTKPSIKLALNGCAPAGGLYAKIEDLNRFYNRPDAKVWGFC